MTIVESKPRSAKMSSKHEKRMLFGIWLSEKITNSVTSGDFLELLKTDSEVEVQESFYDGFDRDIARLQLQLRTKMALKKSIKKANQIALKKELKKQKNKETKRKTKDEEVKQNTIDAHDIYYDGLDDDDDDWTGVNDNEWVAEEEGAVCVAMEEEELVEEEGVEEEGVEEEGATLESS